MQTHGLFTQQSSETLKRVHTKREPSPLPKPPQSFGLFRKDYYRRLQDKFPELKANDVQRVLTDKWRQDESLRDFYADIAASVAHELQRAVLLDERIQKLMSARDIFLAEKDEKTKLNDELDAAHYWPMRNARFVRHLKKFGRTETEQRLEFIEFWNQHCSCDVESLSLLAPQLKIFSPPIDLFQLYQKVIRAGGFESITRQRLWDKVAAGFDSKCMASEKMSAVLLKTFYFEHMYQFEQMFQNPDSQASEKSNLDMIAIIPDPLISPENSKKTSSFLAHPFTGNCKQAVAFRIELL